VVKRCLEKNPEERFQSASDLAFALEAWLDSDSGEMAVVGERRRSRRARAWTAVAGGAVFALAAALVLAWWRTPPAVPVVESVTQLTDDGEPKLGHKLLYTDGSRLYFYEGSSGSWKIAQVSVTGGPISLIDTKLANPAIVGLTPDGSAFLAVDAVLNEPWLPLWSIPLPAGEPRRIGSIGDRWVGFFPDGRILFTQGKDLYVADKDNSNQRKLLSVTAERALGPSVSPDGQRIVFTVLPKDTDALVEVAADGAGLRTLIPGPHVCCGEWSIDGKYLLYQSFSERSSDIWALPMGTALVHRRSQPIRLTTGPLLFTSVFPSRDGKKVFAIGTKQRGELVRYDMKSHEFLPFLSGISALEPTFSQDGKWVAYVSYPNNTLWRSRSDGSEKMQLTYPPMEARFPRISPDGSKVAFESGDLLSDNLRLLIADMNGAAPPTAVAIRVAVGSDGGDWSPDGSLIVFNSYVEGKVFDDKNSYELRITDVRTGKTSAVPSSQGMFGGRWITQNTLVASNQDRTKFLTFDFRTQKWTDLAAAALLASAISPDRKYLYYTTGGVEPRAWRMRFADRRIEAITSLNDPSRAGKMGWIPGINVAPDGSPVFTRDIGTQEVYALNISWPK